MADLWPDDFGKPTVTPPIVILREQADFLARKTGGVVTATVSTRKASIHEMPNELSHDFYLTVPILDDYSFRLFSVTQPIDLYPLTVFDLAMSQEKKAENPDAFLAVLKGIFSSDRTKSIIQGLMASAMSPAA